MNDNFSNEDSEGDSELMKSYLEGIDRPTKFHIKINDSAKNIFRIDKEQLALMFNKSNLRDPDVKGEVKISL